MGGREFELFADALLVLVAHCFQPMYLRKKIAKGETLFGDRLHLRKTSEGVEQIEQRCISCPKLTLQIVWRRAKQFSYALRILMGSGCGNDESHAIFSTPAGSSSHLLQLRSGQGLPAIGASSVGARYHDRARGKVNTGSNR